MSLPARYPRPIARPLAAVASIIALIVLPVPWHTVSEARADSGKAADEAEGAAPKADGEASVHLHNRRIVTFRGSLLGDTPQERADTTRASLAAALGRGGPGEVNVLTAGEAVRFDVDGVSVFFLVPEDLGPRPGVTLEQAAEEVRRRLQTAVSEAREMRDPVRIARGAAYALAATLVAYAIARVVFRARRMAEARLAAALPRWQDKLKVGGIAALRAEHGLVAATRLTTAIAWALVLLTLDLWLSYVLQQFAYTRAWGERLTAWMLGVLADFALAIAEAVPGLVIAVLVFVLARFVARINTLFLERVESGNVRIGWLDADTAGPTRRISNFVIWLFALAMAYPYLPGADSDAFKGVSVLVGLMVSLGASSVVGQALSGFSLMYSRSLRAGEYVKIGETEGTVISIGMFATKVHTGMSEEVSIPNTVIVGNPVRNFSRLAREGTTVVHTAVTIGYATPWRQVHAMLLEAGRRTAGIAQNPPPYVIQTALSDYYIEYRLCAQSGRDGPRRRADLISNLHGNILDVFNEHGVQIMSPHYIADPPELQVVPPERWHAPPAGPPEPAGSGPAPR